MDLAPYTLLLPLLLSSFVESSVMVTVHQGPLRGHELTSRQGRRFVAFQGIPYARPPIGALRFLPPEPPLRWEGVLDATQDANICTQRSIFARQQNVAGSEDCLYLNVYTPRLAGTPLPVMFWIHGGGWVSGAGTRAFYGPEVLLDKDIVLVTINYRLGPLGFLSTGDNECPGNFGLKNQVMALRWVRDNIVQFGGDPDRVTLFGESAGGASVHYHMSAPVSRGLFHRAISQSGVALGSWVLAPNGSSTHQAKKLGRLLDCPVDSSHKLLSCLREKDAREIIATDRQFMKWHVDPLIPFKPVVESWAGAKDAFIPRDPLLTLSTQDALQVPWITGLNSEDGCLKSAPIFADEQLVTQLDRDFSHVAPISMFYGDTSPSVSEVTQRIRQFYFGEGAIDDRNVRKATEMFTDCWFLSGADSAVKLQAAKSKSAVYYYYFTYRGSRSFSELFSGSSRNFGVCHADEVQYLFSTDHVFSGLPSTAEDRRMTDTLTTLWTDFARTGDPTPERRDEISVKWQPFTPDERQYLHIGSELYMGSKLLEKRAEFWASLPLHSHLDQNHTHKDEL